MRGILRNKRAIALSLALQSFGGIELFGYSLVPLSLFSIVYLSVFWLGQKGLIFVLSALIVVSVGVIFDTSLERLYFQSFLICGFCAFLIFHRIFSHESTGSLRLILFPIVLPVMLTTFQFLMWQANFGFSELIVYPEVSYKDYFLAGGAFGNPNNNAFTLYLGMVLLCGLRSRVRSVVYLSLMSALFVLIVLSGSRYFILVSAFVGLYQSFHYMRLRSKGILVLIVGAILAFGLVSIGKVDALFLQQKLLSGELLNFESTLQARLTYLVKFLELDWLLFGGKDIDSSTWIAPHALLLETSNTLGLLGFAGFIAIFLYGANLAFLRYGYLGLFVSITVYLGTHIPSTLVAQPIFFTMVGMILGSIKASLGNRMVNERLEHTLGQSLNTRYSRAHAR